LSEGCPIFYRTDKYELVDGGSFWISETPDEMTKIEGAEHYRICVWVKLRDKTNGEYISVFNAHLDHKGERARELGIEVVLQKMEELGEGTLVLLGDLNDTPDSTAIKTASAALNDAAIYAEVSEGGATHHAWGEELDKERIDYFMISGNADNILEYRVINNLHGESYASDHFPLYVKIRYN
jgi:endonuclease/exonuclease/phosphatase family metal-dependent hydrolase